MGVKKGLNLLESLLALCDLLCVFGQFGLLYEFIQLLELTEAFCTRMNCSSSPSASWLTCVGARTELHLQFSQVAYFANPVRLEFVFSRMTYFVGLEWASSVDVLYFLDVTADVSFVCCR